MAYIQRNTPPPNEIHTFSLKNFVGGLNNRSDLLEANQAHRVLNMSFTNDTVVEKRKGTEVHLSGYSSPVLFIDEYEPYNDPDMLVVSTETEFYLNGSMFRNIQGRLQATNFVGKYFFTDGEKIYAYGRFPQTDTTYEKVVGTATSEYITMEVANPPSGYTRLGTEHIRGVVKYDYANRKVWYEPCELEFTDPFKGANVIPDSPKFIENHNGRVYLTGSDKDNDNVFISDIRNPYYFPVYTPIQLPPNSDKIVGLSVFDNAVVIGRHDDIHVISGNTNNPELGGEVFNLRRLNSHTGFASQDSVKVAHNYLFFLGSDGSAYSLSSTRYDEKTLATQIISRSLDLFKEPFNFSKSDLRESVSCFHDDMWYVSIKDKILVYSYKHMAWTLYDNLDATSFYSLNYELVWGNTRGEICKFSQGNNYLDQGKPYISYWTSKDFDMDDANRYKQFREFFLVAHTFKELPSEIHLRFEIDYAEVESNVVVQNQISVWGRSRFGDRFVNRNINHSQPFSIGQRGRTIRFTFSNGYAPSGTVATRDELDSLLNTKRDDLVYYVSSENTYYVFRDFEWHALTSEDLNQPMRIYQVNGDYEMRGKR